jgi:formylglycine-generating enzyme required for sulfatase activity
MSVAGVPLVAMSFATAQVNAQGQVVNQRQEQCWGYVDDLGNGVKLEMVEIPAGEFLMGEDAAGVAELERECPRIINEAKCKELGVWNFMMPQRRVRVDGFLMGKYEVTQRQWKAVMGSLPTGLNDFDEKFKGDDLPVIRASWDEVQTFLQKLGRGYRLPSEAEWEYAARAGTRTAYAFGPTISPAMVNYEGTYPHGQAAKGVNRRQTVAVGSLGLANAWGLYDMHGNVLEWCEDDWHDSYNGAPSDGRPWVDIANRSPIHVIRGGSWSSPAFFCRSAFRLRIGTGILARDIGFRLSRTSSGR